MLSGHLGRRGSLHHSAHPVILGVAAVVTVVLVADALSATGGVPLWDTHAYWQAALRIREGLPLYDPTLPTDGNIAFRYSPWFAMAWVPLTYLPPALALAIWAVCGAAAWLLCLLPLRGSAVAVLLFGAMTFHGMWVGNVQALMMLPLVYRLHRGDGPLWVAVAASLKAVPILFALVYVGRGECRRAAACVILTAALISPVLLFDLSGYAASASTEGSLLGVSAPLWITVAGLAVIAALRFAPTRYSGMTAGLAALLALPRLILYDVSFLLAGSADHLGHDDREGARSIASGNRQVGGQRAGAAQGSSKGRRRARCRLQFVTVRLISGVCTGRHEGDVRPRRDTSARVACPMLPTPLTATDGRCHAGRVSRAYGRTGRTMPAYKHPRRAVCHR